VTARLDRATANNYERRLRGLRADAPARFGRLDAHAMLRHLRASLELSLGEVEAGRLVPRWIGAPAGWAFTTFLSRWPRGLGGRLAPIPALLPPAQVSFDEDRARLLAALRRFVERLDADPRARVPHPVFGALARWRWARVHALHLDHHLRQFGA
jgi:hypothetical protein